MISLKIAILQSGEEVSIDTANKEAGVVILTGQCNINVNGGEFIWNHIGGRNSVFENPPDTVYIPCHMQMTLQALESPVKIAVIFADAEIQYKPFVVHAHEVPCEVRGEKEWKRSVYDIITTEHPVNSLIIGETIHTGGVWSGYPPHKHDMDDGKYESKNHEIYYVELQPTDTFAIFLQYKDDWEKTTLLKNGDQISVKEGYHAVVSAGGAKFYYLWALDSRNHRFICRLDSRYSWLE